MSTKKSTKNSVMPWLWVPSIGLLTHSPQPQRKNLWSDPYGQGYTIDFRNGTATVYAWFGGQQLARLPYPAAFDEQEPA